MFLFHPGGIDWRSGNNRRSPLRQLGNNTQELRSGVETLLTICDLHGAFTAADNPLLRRHAPHSVQHPPDKNAAADRIHTEHRV